MKFNIKSTDWPFCGPSNSLTFDLILTMPAEERGEKERKPRAMQPNPPPQNQKNKTGGAPKSDQDTKNEQREMRRPPGKKFSADGGSGKDVSMDLPEVVLLDNVAKAATVDCVTDGGKTVIKFNFPYFNDPEI